MVIVYGLFYSSMDDIEGRYQRVLLYPQLTERYLYSDRQGELTECTWIVPGTFDGMYNR